MRLFVGFLLSIHDQTLLSQSFQPPDSRALKPNPSRNLHLTFKFIGQCSPSLKESLIKALSPTAQDARAFELHFDRISTFPNHAPRVIAALAERTPDFVHLTESIDAAFSPLGLTPNQYRITPHLTLARLKETIPFTPKPCDLTLQINKIQLIESQLTSNGAYYTPLLELNLPM